MKNIALIFVLFFCIYSLSAQTNSQKVNKSVVKNVVLINKNPWEVLMTKNGDILAKLKDIPDYLKGVEEGTNAGVAIEKAKSVVVSSPETDVVVYEPKQKEVPMVQKNIANTREFDDDRLEVRFNTGSALLTSKQIELLNDIAAKLASDNSLRFNLFGFNSEPEYRFYILSKRRMDAVLGYLKVKGVDIDNRVVVHSTVKAMNNKIVFAQIR